MRDLRTIGIWMPAGLPHKEYAISDGIVTVILDQSGGINLIEYQGPRCTDGPRRGAFYANGIWRREMFFPEPVIEFALEVGGQSAAFDFRDLVVCPFGVTSRFSVNDADLRYSLWIHGKAILFEWDASQAGRVTLKVREGFLEHHNDFSTWDVPTFCEEFQALRYNLRRNFTMADRGKIQLQHQHEACSLIGSLTGAEHGRAEGMRWLTASLVPMKPCRFVITFGEDVRQVEWLLRDAREHWDEWMDEQTMRYQALAEKAPRLSLKGEPADHALAEIIRTGPLFIESTRRVKNCCEAAFRASTRGYGIWNGWDGQWACNVLNACDSNDTVPRFLNFLEQARGPNHAVPFVADYDFGPIHDANFCTPEMHWQLGEGYHIMHEMWAIANVHQYYFRTGDRGALQRFYPSLARSLRIIHGNASPWGLVNSCFGGADRPEQCNRPPVDTHPGNSRTLTSRLSGSGDMGILYTGCVLGAELAARMGDPQTVARCTEIMGRLQKHFLPIFLDEETGFLVDCVWPKDDPINKNRFFQLISAGLALYGYGELLMLDALERIAAHLRAHHRHPQLGLCNVPLNHPPLPAYELWEDHWLQNATKEIAKLARLVDDRELLDLHFRTFQKHFDSDKLIHEDLYYAHEGGRYDPAKLYMSTSWWQNMTVYAWWHAILESLVGLRHERGQLEYVPGDAGRDVELKNFHWGGHRWRLTVNGRGRWVEKMTVNGEERPGTCQLLPNGEDFNQRVIITKTERSPRSPVLLSAGAAPARVMRADDTRLETTVRSPGFVMLHFYSPAVPRVTVDGVPLEVHWFEARHEGVAWTTSAGDLHLAIDSR